jgi:hypothetical protein
MGVSPYASSALRDEKNPCKYTAVLNWNEYQPTTILKYSYTNADKLQFAAMPFYVVFYVDVLPMYPADAYKPTLSLRA